MKNKEKIDGIKINPKRLQRKRQKGFKLSDLSDNYVCVNRGTKWGNPYKVGKPIQETIGFNTMIINGVATRSQWINNKPLNNHQACILYEIYLKDMIKHEPKKYDLSELKGKNLACFCQIVDKNNKYIMCHADILLSLSNSLTLNEIRDENIKSAIRKESKISK